MRLICTMHRLVAFSFLYAFRCLAQTTDPYCNAEYECEYKTPGGVLYDLRRLCLGSSPYSYTDANGTTYSFQICGTSNVRCQPVGYRVEFNFAPAMQFFGDPPSSSDCTDNFNNPVPCTRACEVLGSGPPIIGLLDASNAYAGVNVSYYSVPNSASDSFSCPINPRTNAPFERTFTAQVACDFNQAVPTVDFVTECGGHNCGPDGCGGYCGPVGYNGVCFDGDECIDGACCQPACHNRNCGDDGCGHGTGCGSCGPGAVCTKYGRCADIISPLPSPAPGSLTTTVSLTSGADLFASFLGGVITTGVATLVALFFARWRSGGIVPK